MIDREKLARARANRARIAHLYRGHEGGLVAHRQWRAFAEALGHKRDEIAREFADLKAPHGLCPYSEWTHREYRELVVEPQRVGEALSVDALLEYVEHLKINITTIERLAGELLDLEADGPNGPDAEV